MAESWHDEEPTNGGGSKSRVVASEPPLDADPLVALGQVMGAVARLSTKVDALALLPSEVTQLRRDVALDRKALVKGAARRSSNRLALLVSSLFVLYDQAAPILHAITKGLHR